MFFQRSHTVCTSWLFASQKVEKVPLMFVPRWSPFVVLSGGLSCCRRAILQEGQISDSDAVELRDVEPPLPRRNEGALLASAFLLCVLIKWRWPAPAVLPDSAGLSWESSSWEKQRGEVKEHLCQGGLHLDSIHRGFTLDDRNALLQWSNLQPTCWPAEQDTEAVPPADCPGYYQVTILGKDVTPVACSVSQASLFQEAGCTSGFYEAVLRNSIS